MIPAAWSALLDREQLSAYLGGICDATTRKVCPVAPVDLGANVLRWRRAEVDAWIESLPHRVLRKPAASVQGEQPAAPEAPAANDRASASLARVAKRVGAGR